MPHRPAARSRASKLLVETTFAILAAAFALSVGAACSSKSAAPDGDASVVDDAGAPLVDASPPAPRTVDAGPMLPFVDGGIGGDRPVTVIAPPNVAPGELRPLFVLLHPYSFKAATEDAYYGISARVLASGAYYAAPEGLVDELDKPYWNGTDACCDLYDTGVDDSAYVRSAIRTILANYPIDARRVWVFGHSNGAFLAHRIACDEASLLTGIVAMAGATFQDPARCKPDAPLHVVTVHGTDDLTIPYDGGATKHSNGTSFPYPGVLETTARWASLNGCTGAPVAADPLRNYEIIVAGDETTAFTRSGCNAEGAVEHWRIAGGGHTPTFDDMFWNDVLRFMADHPRL